MDLPKLRPAPEGDVEVWVKTVVQAGQGEIGRRIPRRNIVIDDLVTIFPDQGRRRQDEETKLLAEGMLEAILERAYRAILVLDYSQGITRHGRKPRRPLVGGGEPVERVKVVPGL